MAKRRRKRSRYGLPAAEHASRAKGELRELRRLQKTLRSKLAGNAPDCVHAAHLVHMIAAREGAYANDRHDSRGRNGAGATESSIHLLERFVHVCVVHSKTRAKILRESSR
jgi:hypothetical protein